MKEQDPSPRQGNTIPAQGEKQEATPRAPHERDESADSQSAGEVSGKRMGQIAHDDLQSGRVDTDKGPASQEAYDKTRAGTPEPEKKFRP